MQKHLIIALLYHLITSFAFAQLSWVDKEITLNPHVNDEQVSAHYSVINTSKTPITITKIKTSCGCTTSKVDNKVISAGDTFELPVSFDIGNRKGTQRKSIRVFASDQEEPHVLNLVVHLPKTLDAKSRVVSWKKDDKISEKTITISSYIKGLSVKEISANNQAIDYKISEANGDFTLSLTPKSTSMKSRTSISVVFTNGVKEFPMTFFSYVR